MDAVVIPVPIIYAVQVDHVVGQCIRRGFQDKRAVRAAEFDRVVPAIHRDLVKIVAEYFAHAVIKADHPLFRRLPGKIHRIVYRDIPGIFLDLDSRHYLAYYELARRDRHRV